MAKKKPACDGRVDMASGYVANGLGHGGHCQAERQGDPDEINFSAHGSATGEEDEEEDAHEFGRQGLHEAHNLFYFIEPDVRQVGRHLCRNSPARKVLAR